MFIKRVFAYLGLAIGFIFIQEPVFAADKGDFYLSGYVGSNLESTAEVLSAVNVGYLLVDGFGMGVNFDQHFGLTPNFRAKEGIGGGPEFRWFLEPVEFSGALIYFFRSYEGVESGIRLTGAGSYLFALTPAIALKAELRFQRDLEEQQNIFYGLLGLRFLF